MKIKLIMQTLLNILIASLINIPFMQNDITIIAASKSLPPTKDIFMINDIKIEKLNDNAINIKLILSQNINSSSDIKIFDNDTFVQINVPNTIAIESGKFYDIDNPIIKKMAIFQNTPSETAIRLFVEKNASKLKDLLKLYFVNNALLLSIDTSKFTSNFENNLSYINQKTDNSVAQNNINDIKDKSNNSENTSHKDTSNSYISSLSLKNKNNFQTEQLLFKDTTDIQNKMLIVSIFSFMLLLLIPILYFYKLFLRRKKTYCNANTLTKINMISSYMLAPRQKLALVEVAGQHLLLGISPDNINYLTKIEINTDKLSNTTHNTLKNTKSLTNQQSQNKISNYISEDTSSTKCITKNINNYIPKQSAINAYLSSKTNKQTKNENQKFEEYVTQSSEENMAEDNQNPNSKVISDVTKMIREKLRNLQPI